MNLHWGKTLEHKWVKVRNRPLNYTIYNQYNYTEYKLTAHKYYWSDALLSPNRTGNQSALYAENQFLKKSGIMTDLFNPSVRSQSFTTVVVIASIFLFLTMTITAAVAVFCRKRNSVFVFQKSEQEDAADYEMDDINTDVEYTETEFDSDTESLRQPRKSSGQADGGLEAPNNAPTGSGAQGVEGCGESDYENSPLRRPLVAGTQNESEAEDSPIRRQHTCRCGGADPRGQYQRMVVTAVLEKPQHASPLGGASGGRCASDDEPSYIQKLDPRLYYSRFEGDAQMLAVANAENGGKPPIINITYADDPPAYDSLDYYSASQSNKHTVTVDIENYTSRFPPQRSPLALPLDIAATTSKADVHYENLPCRDSQVQTDKSAFPPDAAVVFVELPPKDKGPDWPQVCYIDLPPKVDQPASGAMHRPLPPAPTTPLAPPSTPTGGVVGIGLGVMGMVSMSPPDEEQEDEDDDDSIPPELPARRYLPTYSQLQSGDNPPKLIQQPGSEQTKPD